MKRTSSLLTRTPAFRTLKTEARMKELGIELPKFQTAVWSYVKAQKDGNKLYIGDHVGQDETATTVRGKVWLPNSLTELSL